MRSCLSDDEILGFVGGATTASLRPLIHDHLGTCSRCRVLVAQTRKGLPMPAETSGHEPLDNSHSSTEPMPFGTQIGRYQIGALLGSGGAGLVYEAFDPQLSRRVALKILRPDKRSPNAEVDAQRLLREARAMAQLSHPAVVAVYDAGFFDDGVFIAMELVQGRTLARWLTETNHGWQAIVSQFVAAGQGLVAAHAAALIHRDFKAENVLLGADGRPRVTDFGLARASQPHADGDKDAGDGTSGESLTSVRSFLLTLTEAAAFAGTPAYMAPEQFRGARADQATDQFNFCASLYVALYGQPPFVDDAERSLPVLARAVLAGHLRTPPAKSPVPPGFFAILKRGMALDRNARYPSMAQLLLALEQAKTRAAPVTSPQARRLLLGAGASILLVAGYGGYRWTQANQAAAPRSPEATDLPPPPNVAPLPYAQPLPKPDVPKAAMPAEVAQQPPKPARPLRPDAKTRARPPAPRAGLSRSPTPVISPTPPPPTPSPAPSPSPLLDGIKDPYGR